MHTSTRIVLSSDHAAIALRQAIAAHVVARGWVAVDIGPVTPESTHYPRMAKRRRGVLRRAAAGLASCRAAPGRAS
jgi:ribose 5-phosphate isomerase B